MRLFVFCGLINFISSQIPTIDLDDPSLTDTYQSERFACPPPVIGFTVQGSNVNIDMTAVQNATLPTVGAFFLDQGEDVYTSYSSQDWLTSGNDILSYEDMPMICKPVVSSLANLSPSLDVSLCSRWTLVNTDADAESECGSSRTWRYQVNIDDFRNKSFTQRIGNRITWSMWTFEIMSDLTSGSVRHVRHDFLLDYVQTAAVGISIDSGDLMSPAFIEITRLVGERTSATTASFTMETEVYTRYSQNDDEITLGTIYALEMDNDYSCQAPTKTKTGAALSLLDTGESVQRLFTDVDKSGDFLFNKYSVTFQCAYTDNSVVAADDIMLGGESAAVRYELYNENTGQVVSDKTNMPSFKITFSITLFPIEQAETVVTPLEMRILSVSENDYASTQSISEMRDVLDAGSSLTGSVVFTQAFSLHVRTEDVSARGYWNIDPKFIILSLHASTTDVTNDDSFTTVTSENKLTTSFCNLDQNDLVGATIIQDGVTHSIDSAMNYNWTGIMHETMLQTLLTTQITTPEQIELLNGKNFSTLRVNDASGGYYVPMRHRFRFDGVSGGYSMRACILNEMTPRDPSLVSRRLLASTQFVIKSYSVGNIPHSSQHSVNLQQVVFENSDIVADVLVVQQSLTRARTHDELIIVLLSVSISCLIVLMILCCLRQCTRPTRGGHVNAHDLITP